MTRDQFEMSQPIRIHKWLTLAIQAALSSGLLCGLLQCLRSGGHEIMKIEKKSVRPGRRSLFASLTGLATILVLVGCASSGSSSARGYELRIRYAEVVDINRVQLPSAAPAGAVVGGFTGLMIARNRSTGRQLATGAGGAVLGGLATRALEGDRLGYEYRLQFADGNVSEFITEKGYLQVGDCVAVERGQHANIRRVASVLCDNGPVKVIEPTHVRDAEQCHAAKEQLLLASTREEIDIASRKVSVICN